MSWYLENKNGLKIYRCSTVNDSTIVQAFSTRSTGNMGLHTGDIVEQVIANRRTFLKTLDLDINNLVAAGQVHGTKIRVITESQVGLGAYSIENAIPGTDALITNKRGPVLSIYTADCLPVFLYDPVTPTIGIVHAGWRGTIARIVELTVGKMVKEFNTNPAECRVALGPAIGPDCFRVNEDVAKQFRLVDPAVVYQDKSGYQVDLNVFNWKLLLKSGIRSENIDMADICTVCNREDFFSYRAEDGTIGRMMGIISLK